MTTEATKPPTYNAVMNTLAERLGGWNDPDQMMLDEYMAHARAENVRLKVLIDRVVDLNDAGRINMPAEWLAEAWQYRDDYRP